MLAHQERLAALLSFAQVSPSDTVLDIATGIGFVAGALTGAAREVVGIDLTRAMLKKASQKRRERRLENLSLVLGDVETLPFEHESFDVVLSRYAVHHFPDPGKAFREIFRVCRKSGRVITDDIIAPAEAGKAVYFDELQKLRDPSHIKTYNPDELMRLHAGVGLSVTRQATYSVDYTFAEWVSTTNPSPDSVLKSRRMFLDAREGNKAGIPVWVEGEEIMFRHNAIRILALKEH